MKASHFSFSEQYLLVIGCDSQGWVDPIGDGGHKLPIRIAHPLLDQGILFRTIASQSIGTHCRETRDTVRFYRPNLKAPTLVNILQATKLSKKT